MRSAGFDTGSYPGDAAMTAWAAHSPYDFVGYYLDAPCHSPQTFTTWSGKRQLVTELGFGLAVVYVGLQQDGCGLAQLSRDKGLRHGADTIAKCDMEGFPTGTIVFLDVEHFDGALSAAMEAYMRGWISAILDSEGTVNPGIYCPRRKANAIQVAAQKEYDAHGLPDQQPAFWIVRTGLVFDPASSTPDQSGVAFANIWQGRLDIPGETHGDFTISIDQNVADSRDPSKASGLVLT